MVSGSRSVEANRALFVARCSDEVVRRYLTRLKRLRREGFEVHVLAGAGEGIARLRDEGIVARRIPVRHAHNAAGLLGAYFIVQAHLLEHPPLMVHAFGHRVAWLSTFAARRAQVPATFVSFDYHWLEEDPLHLPLGPLALLGVPDVVEQAESQANRVLGRVYRRSMHRAYRWLADEVDRYVVTTEFDFRLLQDMEVVAPEKLEIAVGGAGVDFGEYELEEKGEPDRRQGRRKLNLPEHWRQVVGWVGPVTRRHGADDLVEAITKLRRTHPSVGWLVVGRGQIAGGQARRLRGLERRGFVRFIESETARADYYRAMDVLAWLGRASTPHDAIGEAAALAVPTVGYDTPGARMRIENGQTGHLLYEGEKDSVVALIGRVLDDPRHLSDMGWRARSRVHRHVSRRDSDEQMLRLYDRVLEQKMG